MKKRTRIFGNDHIDGRLGIIAMLAMLALMAVFITGG